MNFLLLGAAALSLSTGVSVDETEGDWLGLDREIENLAQSLAAEGGVKVSGFLRARFENSSDMAFLDDTGGADLSGFTVTNARVAFSGEVGDYGYKVQQEFVGSKLKDAKAWWNCGENIRVTFGNFKTPFSIRFLTSEQKQVFLDRTLTATGDNKGTYFDRDAGLMASGKSNRFAWDIAIQNGEDDIADEYLLTGRASLDIVGDGVLSHEGGYGLHERENGLTAALGFSDDGSIDNGTASTIEVTYNHEMFVASAAVYDFDTGVGDNSPYDFYFSYMITPDEWEAAVRFEDLDDALSTTAVTVGVNKYMGGSDKKWQANVKSLSSDDSDLDGTIVQLGLTLAFP